MDTLAEYAGPGDTGKPDARLTLDSPHNRDALSTTVSETSSFEVHLTRQRVDRN